MGNPFSSDKQKTHAKAVPKNHHVTEKQSSTSIGFSSFHYNSNVNSRLSYTRNVQTEGIEALTETTSYRYNKQAEERQRQKISEYQRNNWKAIYQKETEKKRKQIQELNNLKLAQERERKRKQIQELNNLKLAQKRERKKIQEKANSIIQLQQQHKLLRLKRNNENLRLMNSSRAKYQKQITFQQNSRINTSRITRKESENILTTQRKITKQQINPQTIKRKKYKKENFQNKYQKENNNNVQKFILANNQLEKNYQPPKKNVKIKNVFASPEQYTRIMKILLEHEIIENVNQSIDKKIESPNQNSIEGKVKHFQKEDIKYYQFIPGNQELKKKLKKILLRGSIVCISSTKKQLKLDDIHRHSDSSEITSELCIASFNQEKDQILLDFLNSPRRYYTFLFDLDPIITYQRQMSAVLKSQQFNHIFRIINPQLSEASQQNAARQKISKSATMRQIKQKRNQSQAQTIQKMLIQGNGIHLVQGPPGTGKTDTILNFLSLQLEYLQKQNNNKIILVCSQSNAAIDDIARKIKFQGLINKKLHENCILRLGKMSLASKHLIGYNIRHRCEKQLLNEKTSVQIQIEIEQKQLQLKGVSRERDANQFFKRVREIRKLEQKIIRINQKIQARKREFGLIQQKYLHEAIIVLSTLSASGRNKIIGTYQENVGCLIIDQACQTTQPSILIPFQYQPDKVILVGDPKQLEPTVISTNKMSKYHRSMFQRFIDIGTKPHFLNMQYRMVPEISFYPSRKFYGGKLYNGRTTTKPISFSGLSKKFRQNSILFVDIAYGKEHRKNKSYLNQKQADIISFIARKFVKLDQNLTIGVITPYSSQTIETQNKLMEQIPIVEQRKNIKVSTVDAFQGQQKDVIIMTCVRADNKVGFLNNERRLNVALTRAKNALIVVGKQSTLSRDALWKDYISWMKTKNAFQSFSQQKACKKYIRSLFMKEIKQRQLNSNRMRLNEGFFDDDY